MIKTREEVERQKRMAAERTQRWKEANPERYREAKQRYQARPDQRLKQKARRDARRVEIAAYNRAYRAANPEKVLAHARRYRERNPASIRARNLIAARLKLGIPEATRPQPMNCENCNRVPTGRGQMHLDHDHKTGKFRGWLCGKCNRGIGCLDDSIEGLEQAIAYLRRAYAADSRT